MNRSLATFAGAAALAVMTATASAQQQPAARRPSRIRRSRPARSTPPSPWLPRDSFRHDRHGYTATTSDIQRDTTKGKKKKGKWSAASDTTKPKQ